MNSKELQMMKEFVESVAELKRSNNRFEEVISLRIKEVEEKTEQKHIPISLESDILKSIQISVNDSIKNVLTGYNSPLHGLIKNVIDSNSSSLKQIIDNAFKDSIKTDEFEQSIRQSFSHKIARSMMSMSDSLFEKVSNELKNDVVFKSKMVSAISNVVEEFLKKGDEK